MKIKIRMLIIALFMTSVSSANNMFVELSGGYSNNPYSKKDLNQSIVINPLDENGYLYDFALGYKFTDNVFSTINYQYVNQDEINFKDYYVTLNYKFNQKLNPYLGILIGQSNLHWKIDPLNNSQIRDYDSNSFMYGFQTGLEYKIIKNISFIPKFIYTRTNHKTNLTVLDAKSYLEHKSKSQVLFGFRYLF